jgi:hypothetical protein
MDEVAKYTDSLGATICSDLGNPLLTKLQFQRYVDWLLRLDKGEKVTLKEERKSATKYSFQVW